uniref:Uncharacterized protein n=1 Tax=Oryza sativa subsp. japonica TaxID=39947 RepID=Q84ZJ1_ORYSJ|nr:hypothetical protein [Oryza sativa Japonica Group]BAD30418.1 hypothetical protein [Oryza sativa Japonica Group]
MPSASPAALLCPRSEMPPLCLLRPRAAHARSRRLPSAALGGGVATVDEAGGGRQGGALRRRRLWRRRVYGKERERWQRRRHARSLTDESTTTWRS